MWLMAMCLEEPNKNLQIGAGRNFIQCIIVIYLLILLLPAPKSALHTKEEKFGSNLLLCSLQDCGQSLSEFCHLMPRKRMTAKTHDLDLQAS